MKLDALSPLGVPYGQPSPAQSGRVELQERSDIGAVLCTAAGAKLEPTKPLARALGCPVPSTHGATMSNGDRRAIWLSPKSCIILCKPDEEGGMVQAVFEAFPNREVHASAYSDALCWIAFEGSEVEDALRQGSFLSFDPDGLPSGHAKRTQIAGIPAVVLRENEHTWTIGVERSRGRYFADWIDGLTHTFGDAS